MDERAAHLLDVVRSSGDIQVAWRELFELDAVLASSAAFDLLAGEPRIKPSRRLVIDPGDSVRLRWNVRVAAAAALLASPAARDVFEELRDELAEDADLAANVLTAAQPGQALTTEQLGALRLLGLPDGDELPR